MPSSMPKNSRPQTKGCHQEMFILCLCDIANNNTQLSDFTLGLKDCFKVILVSFISAKITYLLLFGTSIITNH